MAAGRLNLLLSQFPGRFWAPRVIEPSSSITPGQAMPSTGARLRSLFFAALIRMPNMWVSRATASSLSTLWSLWRHSFMSRTRAFDRSLSPEVQINDTDAHIASADIRCKDRVVAIEHPSRQQMRGADQAGLVWVVMDRVKVDIDVVLLQKNGCPSDGQLANPAGAEPAT